MSSPSGSAALGLQQVIDDEVLLTGFHSFVKRYHAEEALLFWMSVEVRAGSVAVRGSSNPAPSAGRASQVFRNRNWKAAKFFGMGAAEDEKPTSPVRRGSKIANTLVRRPSKEAPPKPKTRDLQQRLDEAAAKKMNVTLEQVYLIKEADFIFDVRSKAKLTVSANVVLQTFIRTGSEYWTSFDHTILVSVQRRLQDPTTLTRDVFAEAQAASFSEMSDDLLPRFLREVNEAGTTLPSAKPLTPELKRIKDRVTLLSKAPVRRKTGVSTALAFTFSIARPQKSPGPEVRAHCTTMARALTRIVVRSALPRHPTCVFF